MRRVLILVVLALSTLSMGQSNGKYLVFLVRSPALQKNLGLSASTIAKIDSIESAADRKFMQLLRPKPGSNVATQPSYADTQRIRRETDAKVLSLLSLKQKERLRQVGLQYAGPFALLDADISAQVHLNPDQMKKLHDASDREIARTNQEMSKIRAGTRHLGSGKAEDPRMVARKFAFARTKMFERLSADAEKILSKSQLAQWKALQGKPFPVGQLSENHFATPHGKS